MRCLLFYIIVRFFIISSCLSPFSFDFSVPFICYLALWFQVHVMASSYDVTSMDIFPNTWNWSKAARVIMLLCKVFYFSMSLSYLILVKCRDLHVSAARAVFFGIDCSSWNSLITSVMAGNYATYEFDGLEIWLVQVYWYANFWVLIIMRSKSPLSCDFVK